MQILMTQLFSTQVSRCDADFNDTFIALHVVQVSQTRDGLKQLGSLCMSIKGWIAVHRTEIIPPDSFKWFHLMEDNIEEFKDKRDICALHFGVNMKEKDMKRKHLNDVSILHKFFSYLSFCSFALVLDRKI